MRVKVRLSDALLEMKVLHVASSSFVSVWVPVKVLCGTLHQMGSLYTLWIADLGFIFACLLHSVVMSPVRHLGGRGHFFSASLHASVWNHFLFTTDAH